MPQPLPPKKEVALALLERSRVHVHLDPRKEGVVVPVGFRKQAQLVLEIGLNMPVPIPDLRLDDDGMTCTLSFSRTPFYCAVPWSSVFAMVGDDGRGMVWPDDVPAEIQAQTSRSPETQPQMQKPRAVPALKRAPEPEAAAADKLEKSEKNDKRDKSSEKSDKDEADAKKPAKKGAKAKKQRPMAAVESEPDRPVLVALPQPPAPRGPRAVPNPKKRSAAPTRKPIPGQKGKRELPPYLRVVK